MGIQHDYNSAKADPVDTTLVGATKWNADHYFKGGGVNVGALTYAGVSGLITNLNSVAVGSVLVSAGAGVAPAWSTSLYLNGAVQVGATASMVFSARSLMTSPADGQLNLTNNAGTAGVGLDFGTDGTLAIRNRAQNAYTPLAASTLTATAGVVSLGPNEATTGAVRLANNAYIYSRNVANDANIFVAGVNSSNVVYVGSIGTGSALVLRCSTGQAITFEQESVSRWLVNLSGHLVGGADNTYDIGNSLATRPRNLYVGTNGYFGGELFVNSQAAGNAIITMGASTANNVGRITVNVSNTAYNWRIAFNDSISSSIAFHRSTVVGGTSYTTPMWYMDLNGHFMAGVDNTYDIGASGATRPRAVYVGQHFQVGNNAADAGVLRLLNNSTIVWRNAANSANVNGIGVNASDQIYLGTATDIKWGVALISLGGGATPTLGTIGGSGPASAAQNSWMRVIDSAGVAFWVPAWK